MEYMRWCRGAWDGTSEEASDALRCDPSSSLSQASLKATNPKSCRLDVYGQPRGEMPRMFRQDEAEASLNDRYLEVEGGPLRATKNSSASLIRLAGKIEEGCYRIRPSF